MISGAFSIGVSGLSAINKRMEVTSQNISNANTEGYRKQSVAQSAVSFDNGPIDQGAGTRIDRIYSQINWSLEKQRYALTGNEAYESSKATALGQAEATLSASATMLNDNISELQSAMSNLSTYPTDKAVGQAVLEAGKNLASSVNTTLQTIDTDVANLSKQQSTLVDKVNADMRIVAKYNEDVMRGGQVGDMAKSNAIEAAQNVAKAIGGTMISTDSGQLMLTTDRQSLVVGNTVNEFKPDAIAMSGGQLGGLESAKNELKDAKALLSGAFDSFAASMNTQAQAGQDAQGNPGTAMFTQTAGTWSVSYTSADEIPANGPGGQLGANAMAMAGMGAADAPAKLTESIGVMAVKLGTAVNRAQDNERLQEAGLDAVNSQIAAESGVDLDQEAVNLVNLQNQYAAMARVISAQNDMIGTLLQATA